MCGFGTWTGHRRTRCARKHACTPRHTAKRAQGRDAPRGARHVTRRIGVGRGSSRGIPRHGGRRTRGHDDLQERRSFLGQAVRAPSALHTGAAASLCVCVRAGAQAQSIMDRRAHGFLVEWLTEHGANCHVHAGQRMIYKNAAWFVRRAGIPQAQSRSTHIRTFMATRMVAYSQSWSYSQSGLLWGGSRSSARAPPLRCFSYTQARR